MRRTKVICYEGGEMVGKTTSIINVQNALEAMGFKVYVTREPGGCELAEDIRRVLLDKKYTNEMDTHIEAMLFAAARRAHLTNKIIPLLASNEYDYIIFDRFIMSSLVYQGYMTAIEETDMTDMFTHAGILNPDAPKYNEFRSAYLNNFERIFQVNSEAINIDGALFIPDITFVLDMDCEKALCRKRADSERNRLDSKPIDWHKDIRNGYLLANNFMHDDMRLHANICIINADESEQDITSRILIKINRL